MSSSTIVDRLPDTSISDTLTELALDLRWSFNHSADQLSEQLDPELWELTHNPWVVLQIAPDDRDGSPPAHSAVQPMLPR